MLPTTKNLKSSCYGLVKHCNIGFICQNKQNIFRNHFLAVNRMKICVCKPNGMCVMEWGDVTDMSGWVRLCILLYDVSPRLSYQHVILLTILTLGAGGRFDSHFWTQSGAPSPYLAFRAPPAFKLYMVLKACPAFNPYLALRAPLPPLSSYIWCWKRAPPLSTHIWHSERPPAFKLYMVLRACPAFNPYLAFRAPPAFKLYFVLKVGPYLVFRASEPRGTDKFSPWWHRSIPKTNVLCQLYDPC